MSGRARRHRACRLAVLVWLLTGCATAYRSGEVALEEGRYEDASAKFGEALAGHPDRPEALFGLGLAQYRLGSFDAAVASLGRAVLVSPDRADVRLYLALGYLALGSQDLAAGQLAVLLEQDIHPRIAAQARRALGLLRGEALSAEIRDFVRQSLDDEARWYQDVQEARLAPHLYFGPAWFVRDPAGWSPLGWYPYGFPGP
ncbi:MAG TPA: tetratricopeptide repeat protein [Verrucomicrobiae bacterium]|nr:tetratricopeptide repeat protein [Verrucomicrobiae bacterium]